MQKIETEIVKYYRVKDNLLLPSVNTIIENTRDNKKQQKLQEWRDKTPLEIQESVKERGSWIHKQIETYCQGGQLPDFSSAPKIIPVNNKDRTTNIAEYWQPFAEFFSQYQPETQGLEIQVTNHELKYAGTLDWYGDLRFQPTIIDFKTSHRPKKREYLDEIRLQLVAYKLGIKETLDIEIEQTAIIVGSPNKLQVFIFEEEDLIESEIIWKEKVKSFYQNSIAISH